MSREFVTFTKDQFEAALAAALQPFKGREGVRLIRDKQQGEEYTYTIVTGNHLVYLKIYSSVSPVTNQSREYAADAIRFVIMDKLSEKPVGEKKAHAKRVTNWRDNVAKRIAILFTEVDTLTFCSCGSPKVERENRTTKQKFLGCVNWANHNKPQEAVSAQRRGHRGTYTGD